MLHRATCKQSYIKWRLDIFRELAEDALYEARYEKPSLLHLKSLRHRRCFHNSPPRSAPSEPSQNTVKEDRDADTANQPDPQADTAPPHPRKIPKIWRKGVWDEPLAETSRLSRDHKADKPEHVVQHWRPLSAEGQHDLRSLAESLHSLSASLESQALNGLSAVRDEHWSETSPSWLGSVPQGIKDFDIPSSPLEKHIGKTKWVPKRAPTSEEKERLANNPWAAMLASPMRFESATRSRLPGALLMHLGKVANPEDSHVYMLPDDLADLDAFNKRLRKAKASSAMRRGDNTKAGQTVRVLPYKLLMEELTDSFLVWSTSKKEGDTKAGAVARRLFPRRWHEKDEKFEAYREASKAYWRIRERESQLDDNAFKQPEPPLEASKMKWQPEIAERIPNIMRQRVLLALNQMAQKQNMPNDKQRLNFYCLPWPDGPSLNVSGTLLCESEHWNDTGDIEKSEVINTGAHDPGRDQSDVAVQPSEIRDESENILCIKNDPREWLPGSFILHVGPPNTALSALPYLDPAGISSTDMLDTDDPAFNQSKFIPPMLKIAETYRVPIFNMRAMLGPRLSNFLDKILAKHRHFQEIPSGVGAEQNQNHIILIKPTAPCSHHLAQELWQLWRYLGGRDCLLQAINAKRQRGAGIRYVTEGPKEKWLRSKTKNISLSETAWKYLHELLELKYTPPSERVMETQREGETEASKPRPGSA